MKPLRRASVAPLGDPTFMPQRNAMSTEFLAHNHPVSDQLHPKIYGIAVGLIAWFALMAWLLFDRGGEVSLPLIFVTVLFVVAIALPWTLSLVLRRSQSPQEQDVQSTSFREWSEGEFAVWGARLHGREAAVDALLPLIAVSFGLTGIGIVFVIVRAFAT
jgi:hypothetical protein